MHLTSETLNPIGKVSYFFSVHRPLSLLMFVIALAFGLLAFMLTPKQYNPEIIRPAFSVSIFYGGATQTESIDRVVYELVEKIVTVPGVDEVHTTVTDDSLIRSTVIFDVGYDPVKAKVDLLSQIQQNEYLARGFIQPPEIVEINPETIPVLQIVFSSEVDDIATVRSQVVDLSHEIMSVPDVAAVDVVGGYDPSLVLALNPAALHAHGINISDVVQVLQNSQIRFTGAGFVDKHTTVGFVFDGRTESAADVGALQIQDGIHIRDIASVYTGASTNRGYVLHDTAGAAPGEVVVLAVSKVEGASAPALTSRVLSEIETLLTTDTFQNLSYRTVSDDGVTAQSEIFGLTKNLMMSVTIVVLVLLLFLSFRAAAVVFIVIPMTLLVVFAIGYLFDQTINRITLFALILSLGLLVDSAIVVVENIYEHLRRVSNQTIAATREIIIAGAVHEIGVGLLLSTLTSVIVFLPMRYISGMMGPYMGPIAFFVPAALVVSLFVAVIAAPFVATYLLHGEQKKSRLNLFVDRLMYMLTQRYQVLLQNILYNRSLQKSVLLGALGLFLATLILPLTGLVHFQMLPRADRDQFYVYIDAPVGTSVEYTKDIAQTVSDLLTQDQSVVSIQQYIAQAPVLDFNGMFKGAQERTAAQQATLRVNLKHTDQRARSSTQIVTDIRHKFVDTYPAYVPMLRFVEEPPGPPVRATLVAKVSAATPEVSDNFTSALYNFFGTVDGVVDRHTSQEENVGRVAYTFNHQKADMYDVSLHAVSDTLRALAGPYLVTEYLASDAGEFTPVTVIMAHEYKDAPSDIAHIYVRNTQGVMIPLDAVVDVSYQPRPTVVSFEGVQPLTYVTGEIENRSVVYVVIESIHRLIQGELPGYTVEDWGLFSMSLRTQTGETVQLAWGGEWKMTLENFRDLGVAMGVALLLVYFVLVAQYNSFRKPAYILVTVPLGLIGILWGFFFLDFFFGIYLTATALIGFIALMGLVVNNAIIYLEYVEQLQESGYSFRKALLGAGEARLRPIFLTSLTTILGSLTIVNDPVWSGLAWSIIFGLSLSTILTLVMYPTLLVYFSDIEQEEERT